MKVALMLTGIIPYNFETYFDSIHKTLIEPYNTDVFISSWKSEYIDDVFAHYKPVLMRLEDMKDISIKHRLNTKLVQLKQTGYTGNRDIYLESTYPMFYKIYDVNLLRKEYQDFNNFKYDLVFRCRMDLDFSQKHPSMVTEPNVVERVLIEEITDCIKNKNRIYLRKDNDKEMVWDQLRKNNDIEIVWDQFAFGDSDSMDKYCNTFVNLNKIIKKDCVINEQILTENLNLCGVETFCTKTSYGIKTH
jgi:hypothetical protein